MYEGSTPLEDFLHTLNRLQAEFERRLGSIERTALPGPLVPAHAQERKPSLKWTQEDGYRPLGLEAIWTSDRTPTDVRPIGGQEPVASAHLGTLVD
ncbi:hypothetical protein [Streptomyces sp. NPDC058382]|uniref:hypothetical protein n=1 Tax=unclassified Streptomyces TaxID=2593676 RepID=UPI00363DAA39